MRIRKMKPGVVINCTYCKAQANKVPATWHLTGANIQACDDHKHLLEIRRDLHNENQNPDYSEADHETWLKL